MAGSPCNHLGLRQEVASQVKVQEAGSGTGQLGHRGKTLAATPAVPSFPSPTPDHCSALTTAQAECLPRVLVHPSSWLGCYVQGFSNGNVSMPRLRRTSATSGTWKNHQEPPKRRKQDQRIELIQGIKQIKVFSLQRRNWTPEIKTVPICKCPFVTKPIFRSSSHRKTNV